jgi:hypothetical protein
MKSHLGTCLLGAALAIQASPALAQTVYYGGVTTDMSGVSCRSSTNVSEGSSVYREITEGFMTASSLSGALTAYCPLTRRNTTDYGRDASSLDRVLMTSLRISVYDGKSSARLSCTAYVGTAVSATYWSSTRYACSSTGGCTSAPSTSFRGASELRWTNPFGSSAIVNKGAANVGYSCSVPGISNLYWARAQFSPNN